jgi:hypothetical protein
MNECKMLILETIMDKVLQDTSHDVKMHAEFTDNLQASTIFFAQETDPNKLNKIGKVTWFDVGDEIGLAYVAGPPEVDIAREHYDPHDPDSLQKLERDVRAIIEFWNSESGAVPAGCL